MRARFSVKGTLKDVSQNEKIAVWVLAVTMTLFALTSLMG